MNGIYGSAQQSIALLALAVLCGCQPDVPATAAPPEPSATSPYPGEQQTVEFLNLRGLVPISWQVEAPSSSMRLIQYRVPGAEQSDAAEFVVFYFGPGQGGTPAANIARWRSQFSSDKGAAVEPEIDQLSAGDMPVTFVALSGSYARGVGAGSMTATPGQTLLAAIVETSHGNIYAQLYGPTAAVARERTGFLAFATSLTPDPVDDGPSRAPDSTESSSN